MERLRKLKRFVQDVVSELKKTTWPGKQEVYGTTMVVIITVLICAGYLWVVDLLLNNGMNAIFRMFGR